MEQLEDALKKDGEDREKALKEIDSLNTANELI